MKAFPLLKIMLLLSGGLLPLASSGQAIQDDHGNPSDLDQYMLELINRARLNPANEGIILDTADTDYTRNARKERPQFFANLRGEFASYPAVSPVPFNSKLMTAARKHTQDMIMRGYFEHVNPEGLDPTQRAAAVGYDANVAENIDGSGAANAAEVAESHLSLMIDAYNLFDNASHLGHRLNILASDNTELGLGIGGNLSDGKITQDFGAADRRFILGVAYTDRNGNHFYDPGEGMSGVTVRPGSGNHFAVTSSSGGYAILLEPVETQVKEQSIPIAINGSTYEQYKVYDDQFRQQELQNAPETEIQLTWSGGGLSAPTTTTVRVKRPVRINYKLTGTDGYYYPNLSFTTSSSVKSDLIAANNGTGGSGSGPAHQDVFGTLTASTKAGWVKSPWLGQFNQSKFPVIEHETLGKMTVSGTSPDSLYFKITKLGLVYTSQKDYPWMYSYAKKAWLRYKIGSKNPRKFFNPKTRQTYKY